jgi:hypothetical protein
VACDGLHISGGSYSCVVRRATPTEDALNPYGRKNHIRRFLRRRHDAVKTRPLSLMRRRLPDLRHTLHPKAAPIFSYENVFLRSRSFSRTRARERHTNHFDDRERRSGARLNRNFLSVNVTLRVPVRESRVTHPSIRPTRRANSRENKSSLKKQTPAPLPARATRCRVGGSTPSGRKGFRVADAREKKRGQISLRSVLSRGVERAFRCERCRDDRAPKRGPSGSFRASRAGGFSARLALANREPSLLLHDRGADDAGEADLLSLVPTVRHGTAPSDVFSV